MDSSTHPIFCCGSATLVVPQKARKHHKDPNREVHEAIFHSFLAFAVRRQRAATLMMMVMGGIGGGILTPPESRAVTPVLGLKVRRGLIPMSIQESRSRPTDISTQILRPTRMLTPSPIRVSSPTPIPAQISKPTQRPTLTQMQISTPTQMPTPTEIVGPTQMPTSVQTPATSPPPPVLSPSSLANNPLTPQTAYVLQLTSRHDFGPVYSHRYFACPPSLQHDWPEISLEQWFAAGESFKMRADQRDLKCLGDGRFFRMVLRPNLGMRGFDDGGGGGGDGGRRWRRNWWQ